MLWKALLVQYEVTWAQEYDESPEYGLSIQAQIRCPHVAGQLFAMSTLNISTLQYFFALEHGRLARGLTLESVHAMIRTVPMCMHVLQQAC